MERSVVPASLILSNSLCSHVFCDILITEIVLEGQSKAVFAFVCTSVYMFIRDVCVIGGLGGGVGLDREIQPRQLLILCLRVPLLCIMIVLRKRSVCFFFYIFDFFVSFIAALRQFVVLLSKRTIVMYEGYVECMNCIFFSKVQLLILSAFKCSDDLFM